MNIETQGKYLIPSLLSCFTSLLILTLAPKYFLVAALVFLLFFVITIINKPFVLFQILIAFMPFALLPNINEQLMGIPGLKMINLLIVAVYGSFFIAKLPTKSNFYEKLFIVGMLSLLIIAVFRALPHIPIFNVEMNEDFSRVRFFQTFFMKPFLYFSPFILVSLYCSEQVKIEALLKAFVFSIAIFSVVLLTVYIFYTPDKTSFESIRSSLASVLHMHGNNIATIYILSFPVLMSYFYITRNIFSILSIILSLSTVAILYSRTAYVVILISIFLYLYISKRINWVPVTLGLLALVMLNSPSSFSERFMTGVESRNIQEISAGRVGEIWVPLVNELKEHPGTLIFGNGMRGYWSTAAFNKRQIYGAGHAHNLYLDAILDIGLLGLGLLGLFCFLFIKNVFRAINKQSYDHKRSEILCGVIVSVLAYLISGMTGRLWYPVIYNFPLWLILALGAAILKTQPKGKAA